MRVHQIASTPPSPTAQTPKSNGLIFWRETHHGNAFRGTEAIFEFHLSSRDMTEKCAIFAGLLGPDLSPQKARNEPISLHPGQNSKIASVPRKVSP